MKCVAVSMKHQTWLSSAFCRTGFTRSKRILDRRMAGLSSEKLQWFTVIINVVQVNSAARRRRRQEYDGKILRTRAVLCSEHNFPNHSNFFRRHYLLLVRNPISISCLPRHFDRFIRIFYGSPPPGNFCVSTLCLNTTTQSCVCLPRNGLHFKRHFNTRHFNTILCLPAPKWKHWRLYESSSQHIFKNANPLLWLSLAFFNLAFFRLSWSPSSTRWYRMQKFLIQDIGNITFNQNINHDIWF